MSWDDIKSGNRDLLRKLDPSIASPGMSSSVSALYRLRTGPFSSRSAAESLCDHLDARGVSCLVVDPQ